MFNHFTPSAPTEVSERQEIWDEICDEVMPFMTIPTYLLFTITGWEETDGVSLSEAYHHNDLDTMRKILDLIKRERASHDGQREAFRRGDMVSV